jgi:hypothetical protein
MNCFRLTSIAALASAMLVFFLVGGCASRPAGVKTITHQQLVEIVAPTYQQSFIATVTYYGSNEGFDYFTVMMPFTSSGRATEYRIHEWDSPIRNRFPLNSRFVGYNPTSGLTDDEMRSELERFLRRNAISPWLTNTVDERLFDTPPKVWSLGSTNR